MPEAPLLEVRNLGKQFEDVEAVADVSFSVSEGESRKVDPPKLFSADV